MGGGWRRGPAGPPRGWGRGPPLPAPPRPGAPTAVAGSPPASAVGPTPGVLEGRRGPAPGGLASIGGRSADPRPSARPQHARGLHAGGVRWRVTVAARARPGSPVGACAPPTRDYRTLLMQKSLVTGRDRGAAAVLLVFGLIALEEASRLR